MLEFSSFDFIIIIVQRFLKAKPMGYLVGGIILFLIMIGVWSLVSILHPHVEHPSGKAKLTGKCGDTMELCLRFKDNKVVESSYWTDGCMYSLNSIFMAAELSKGKGPDEIIEIDSSHIEEALGGLPDTHKHCAMLAAETLHAAVEDYIKKQVSSKT